MKTVVELLPHRTGLVRIAGRLCDAADYRMLSDALSRSAAQGCRRVIVEMSMIDRLSGEGIFALVEALTHHADLHIALCGLGEDKRRALARSGMDRFMNIHADIDEALDQPAFRADALGDVDAVILSADDPDPSSPITRDIPAVLVPLLGKPVAHRITEHLAGLGVKSVHFNPGHCGPMIAESFDTLSAEFAMPIQFHGEGRQTQYGWKAESQGSASTLARLYHRNNLLKGDVLVLFGDVWPSLNLAEFRARHRDSGADMTIATCETDHPVSDLLPMVAVDGNGRVEGMWQSMSMDTNAEGKATAPAGAIFLRSALLELLEDRPGIDIFEDFLPLVLANGCKVDAYALPNVPHSAVSPKGLFRLQEIGLAGSDAGLLPSGSRGADDIWAEPGAVIGKHARISGPVWIGAGARIDDGATIVGPATIGRGAHLADGAYVQRSVISDDVDVAFGTWVNDMIAHFDWAIGHDPAPQAPYAAEPLDGLSRASTVRANVDANQAQDGRFWSRALGGVRPNRREAS